MDNILFYLCGKELDIKLCKGEFRREMQFFKKKINLHPSLKFTFQFSCVHPYQQSHKKHILEHSKTLHGVKHFVTFLKRCLISGFFSLVIKILEVTFSSRPLYTTQFLKQLVVKSIFPH